MTPTIGHDNAQAAGTAEIPAAARRGAPQHTPSGFEQRLLARARALNLPPGSKIVVAFSGGRDSLALAGALRWVTSRLGFEPVPVHVDHRLRESSREEAARAAELAAALGLRFVVHAVSGAVSHHHPGLGIEEAARRERYRLLWDAAQSEGAPIIATGHHQNDQAETVLLHLLRGSGVHGARGMAELSDVPHWPADQNDISPEAQSAILWRPLLRESRGEIDAYVARLGIEPIADPTNDDRAFRRNALRLETLPRLEEQIPGAVVALARFAELAADDDLLLDELAARALAKAVHQGGALATAGLRRQPIALQRRMVRHWAAVAGGPGGLTMDRTEAILELAHAGRGGSTLEIGGGWTVRRERGMLHLGSGGDGGGVA